MILGTKSNIEIEKYLSNKKTLIDKKLESIFEDKNLFANPSELWDAVKYSLLNGGKRIRGILCISVFESLLTEKENPKLLEDCLIVACSIEMIHSMSLIHDDLPSMDNDDLRRGIPTCHKAHGEAIAILAGDALLTLPFYLISKNTKHISAQQKLDLISELSKAFTFGLVPGQIYDINPTNKKYNIKDIENTSRLKTAELIKSSVVCGGIVSGKPDDGLLNILNSFGLSLGIAFQIIDDILDITSDSKTLGKTAGKDKKQNKITYPSLSGIKEAKNYAKVLTENANKELRKLVQDNRTLTSIADFIINRIN